MEGSWLGKFYIDKKLYWDVHAQIPEYPKEVSNLKRKDVNIEPTNKNDKSNEENHNKIK